MTARSPRRYRLGDLPHVYLAFRTTSDEGRELLSLVPDTEEQHILDVAAAFVDDPSLVEVDLEGDPLEHCCEICGHSWGEHSPENGCCLHVHRDGEGGLCLCGRDLSFMHRKMTRLSRLDLADRLSEAAAEVG